MGPATSAMHQDLMEHKTKQVRAEDSITNLNISEKKERLRGCCKIWKPVDTATDNTSNINNWFYKVNTEFR